MENNDLNLQMQNPNVSSPMTSIPTGNKKYSPWLVVTIAMVVAGLVWWYFSSMQGSLLPQLPVPTPTPEAVIQSDLQLSSEVESVDLGNLDSEFKDIDNDLSSL